MHKNSKNKKITKKAIFLLTLEIPFGILLVHSKKRRAK